MESSSHRTRITPNAPYPRAAEGLLLLVLALAPLVAGHQDALPPLVLACLVWAACLARVVLGRTLPVRGVSRATTWLVALFPVLAALSFVTSANRGATVTQFCLFAAFAGVCWLSAEVAAYGGAGRLLGALLAGALIEAGIGLQDYLIHMRHGDAGWRVSGAPDGNPFFGFTNPNFFAGYLIPALLLVVSLALSRPDSFKPETWLVVLVLLTGTTHGALMATGSRGGLAAFAFGLLVLLVFAARQKRLSDPEVRIRLAALAVTLAVVTAGLSGTIRGRAQDTGAAPAAAGTLCPPEMEASRGISNPLRKLKIDDFRYLTWKATLAMGKRRPLLGWGAGSFETTFAASAIAGFTRHAHNTYLQLFAEEGVAAPVLWVVLLLLAAVLLWRRREGEAGAGMVWIPGAAGALAAGALHNLTDSLVLVPAIGFLTFALLGMAYSLRDAPPVPVRAGGGVPWKQGLALLGAVAMLLLTGGQAIGKQLLAEGREQTQKDDPSCIDTLNQAQALLPWDHQVADEQRRAYIRRGRLDDAVEAAKRAIQLAPYRPPGHYFLGNLWRGLGDPNKAAIQYQIGLETVPHEVQLLYARAQVLTELGLRDEALGMYRRIVQTADTPVAQVRALGEVLDFRYARARQEVARAEEGVGHAEPAYRQRWMAACFLAQRRRLFDGNPGAYFAVGERDRDNENRLRQEEIALWKWLSTEFMHRHDTARASESLKEVDAVRRSWEELQKLPQELWSGVSG